MDKKNIFLGVVLFDVALTLVNFALFVKTGSPFSLIASVICGGCGVFVYSLYKKM